MHPSPTIDAHDWAWRRIHAHRRFFFRIIWRSLDDNIFLTDSIALLDGPRGRPYDQQYHQNNISYLYNKLSQNNNQTNYSHTIVHEVSYDDGAWGYVANKNNTHTLSISYPACKNIFPLAITIILPYTVVFVFGNLIIWYFRFSLLYF